MITGVRPTSSLQPTYQHFACHHQNMIAFKIIIFFLSSLRRSSVTGVCLSQAFVHQALCSPTLCLPSPTSDCLQNNHFLFIVFMITGVCTTSSVQPKQRLTIVVIAIFTKYCVVKSFAKSAKYTIVHCITKYFS